MMRTMIRMGRRFGAFGGFGLVVIAAVLVVHAAIVDADQPGFALLVRARGTVQYQAAGTASWVRATERMRVNVGDRINTGPDGSAVLKLSNGNFLNLHANGQVTLAEMTSRPGVDPNERVLGLFPARIRNQEIRADLSRGRAVSVLRGLRGQSTYNLRTPVATAGVRGTVFAADVVWADGAKQAGGNGVNVNFSVFEGSVGVSGNVPGVFSPITLNEGMSLSIAGTGDGGVSGAPQSAPMTSQQNQEIQQTVDQTLSTENPLPENVIQSDILDKSSDNHYYY